MAKKKITKKKPGKIDLDNEIKVLYSESLIRVDKSLKSINIALKLNAPKLKKQLPPDKVRLIQWRDALEYWKVRYGEETEDAEVMAERLGALYEICAEIR